MSSRLHSETNLLRALCDLEFTSSSRFFVASLDRDREMDLRHAPGAQINYTHVKSPVHNPVLSFSFVCFPISLSLSLSFPYYFHSSFLYLFFVNPIRPYVFFQFLYYFCVTSLRLAEDSYTWQITFTRYLKPSIAMVTALTWSRVHTTPNRSEPLR